MSTLWSDAEIAECIRLREQGLEWADVGKEMDRPPDSCRRIFRREKGSDNPTTSERKTTVSGDECSVQYVTTAAIKTEEEALVAGNVDRKVWIVDKMELTDWTTTVVFDGQVKQIQNYRVNLKLK